LRLPLCLGGGSARAFATKPGHRLPGG
jgi:hypothetical protein